MPTTGRQVQLLAEMATRFLEFKGYRQNSPRHVVMAVTACAGLLSEPKSGHENQHLGLIDGAIDLLLKPKA